MSTTAEKLQKIIDIKNDLKEKINAKGGSITNTTPFAEYSIQVENISGGNSYDYVVTFINWNGDILQTNYVMSGDSVTYEGATPTKSVDDDYMYFFNGWDKSLDNITSDTIIMAEYEQKECSLFEVEISNSNELKPYICQGRSTCDITVDWGDGELSFFKNVDSSYNTEFLQKTNEYASLGIYIIKIWVDKKNVASRYKQELKICYAKNTSNTIKMTRFKFQENIVNCLGEKQFFNFETELFEVPNYIKSINLNCFLNSTIYEILLPNSLTEILSYAFYNCKNLTKITIPVNVTKIDNYAFGGCSNLKIVEFTQNTPPKIYSNIFVDCSSIEAILVPDSAIDTYKTTTNLSEYGDYIIGVEEYKKISIIANGTYDVTNKTTAIVNVPDIPANLQTKTLTPTESVQNVTPDRGYEGFSLVTVNAIPSSYIQPSGTLEITENGEKDVTNYEKVNVIISTSGGTNDNTVLTKIIEKSSIDNLQIPSEVKTIAPYSFYKYSLLKKVTLNENIISIEQYAFSESGIEEIVLPESLTSLGKEVFKGCFNLKSVEFKNSMSSIPRLSFSNCDVLNSIILPSGLTSIDSEAFYSCDSLETINLPETLTTIDSSAFRESGLKTIIIPNSVKTLSAYAFEGCNSLETLVIPSSITSLGNYIFRNCNSLKYVTLHEGLSKISYYMFGNCSSLENIVIPRSITAIEEYAFYQCNNLKNVIINEGVTNIKDYVFQNCTNLINITIPNSVTRIGYASLQTGSEENKTTFVFTSATPPTITYNTFNKNYLKYIVVPTENLQTYKTQTNWSTLADYIVTNFYLSDIPSIAISLADEEDKVVELNYYAENPIFSVSVTDSSICTANIDNNGILTLTGLAIGETSITVTMTNSSGTESVTKTTTVKVTESLQFSFEVENIEEEYWDIDYEEINPDENIWETSEIEMGNYAMCKIKINADGVSRFTLQEYTEGDYYMTYISKLDTEFSNDSSWEPSSNCQYAGDWADYGVEYDYGIIPAGEHYIYVKCVQDYNDFGYYCRHSFKITVSV